MVLHPDTILGCDKREFIPCLSPQPQIWKTKNLMVANKPVLNHFPNTLRDNSVLTDDFTWWGRIVGEREVKQVAMYNQKLGYHMIDFNQCGQLSLLLAHITKVGNCRKKNYNSRLTLSAKSSWIRGRYSNRHPWIPPQWGMRKLLEPPNALQKDNSLVFALISIK